MKSTKYLLQGNNGCGWITISKSTDLKVSIQRCEQLGKQKRGGTGTEWYRSRVVVEENGEFIRVYPPRKES